MSGLQPLIPEIITIRRRSLRSVRFPFEGETYVINKWGRDR